MGVVMNLYLMAALCAFPCSSAPVSSSPLVVVRTPVTVASGQTTTLPCWLNPTQSAEGLEVRWYLRDEFDAPAVLYQRNQFSSKDASYAGRVAFGRKDARSGGLKTGDVSLELVNATLQDSGDYTCFVRSDQGYDSASISLTVTKTGAPPLLSAEWKDDVLNVSCRSEGWYPQPTLRWWDGKQDLTPEGLKYSTDSSGHLSVHSWILVSSSLKFSCSVGLSGEEEKVARIPLGTSQKQCTESGSSAAGWVAFALLLIVGLILLSLFGVWYFRRRRTGKRDISEQHQADGKRDISEQHQADENQTLLSKDVVKPRDFSDVRGISTDNYENVTLEETNPYVKIKDGILREADCPFPDGQQVTCHTSIRGTSGFSSGQHYWEVSLKSEHVDPKRSWWVRAKSRPVEVKKSWWIGVTSVTGKLHECILPPDASNGFWFLSSSPDREDNLQLSTGNVSLYVSKRPEVVGVFLDYDKGELSFYNVNDKCLIASLTASFSGEVFPLFNLGIGDTSPMKVLQRAAQSQGSPESDMNALESKDAQS